MHRRWIVSGLLAFSQIATGMAPPASHIGVAKDAMAAIIGTAEMLPDGTIILRLESPDMHAMGEFRYAPGDLDYDEVLKHLNGLSPGQIKPVPAWPD
jgi:hypothetical protein